MRSRGARQHGARTVARCRRTRPDCSSVVCIKIHTLIPVGNAQGIIPTSPQPSLVKGQHDSKISQGRRFFHLCAGFKSKIHFMNHHQDPTTNSDRCLEPHLGCNKNEGTHRHGRASHFWTDIFYLIIASMATWVCLSS